MKTETMCVGPGQKPGEPCGRDVLAKNLCAGHYAQQEKRKVPLAPLMLPRGQRMPEPIQKRLDVGLNEATRDACATVGARLGMTPKYAATTGARAVLEAWFRGELVPKSKRATPHLVREDTSGA